MSCRRCASWRVPTRSSTARSSSRPAIPDVARDRGLFARLGLTAEAHEAEPRRRLTQAASASSTRGAAAARAVRTVAADRARQPRMLALADGTRLVDFSSNDYLGPRAITPGSRAPWPRVRRAPAPAAALRTSSPVTAASTRNSRRSSPPSPRRERALLFSTGYMANLAVMSALAGSGERVALDRLCHASLIDGALLSGARP